MLYVCLGFAKVRARPRLEWVADTVAGVAAITVMICTMCDLVQSLQLAKDAARASLESRVLLMLDTEFRRRRISIIRSRSDTAVYPTEADYSAALDALNATYVQIQDNVQQHRHSSVCEATLAPINLPALGVIPEELAWDASLSAGAAKLVVASNI